MQAVLNDLIEVLCVCMQVLLVYFRLAHWLLFQFFDLLLHFFGFEPFVHVVVVATDGASVSLVHWVLHYWLSWRACGEHLVDALRLAFVLKFYVLQKKPLALVLQKLRLNLLGSSFLTYCRAMLACFACRWRLGLPTRLRLTLWPEIWWIWLVERLSLCINNTIILSYLTRRSKLASRHDCKVHRCRH